MQFLPNTEILVCQIPDEPFEMLKEGAYKGISDKQSLEDPQYASIRQEYTMPIPVLFQVWLQGVIDNMFELHKERYGIFNTEPDMLQIAKMWVNVMEKGDQHFPHMHEHAFYSFAAYIKVDDNDAPFYFIKDNRGSRIDINKESEKHMLIFPSGLIHTVYPKESEGQRISVSGNVILDLKS